MVGKSLNKCQFGDFQTPDSLAHSVVSLLKRNHHIEPQVIIESSCGKGAFIRAANSGFKQTKILGFDINNNYIIDAISSLKHSEAQNQIIIEQGDFFELSWNQIISNETGFILVLGNPPWITSSELGALNSTNLPEKSNFQNRKGIDAITGSGNFDISEWMLLQQLNWLSTRQGAIAVLCKISVARKVMQRVMIGENPRYIGHIYPINAKEHFDAAVEACLFVLIAGDGNADCDIYQSMDSTEPLRAIGTRNGRIVNNIADYEKTIHLAGQDIRYIWRSGIKHDCSKVMEFDVIKSGLLNGLGEFVELEDHYIFPLLKSSDIGNGRCNTFRKMVLVTQRSVGESTEGIHENAPRTWNYLQNHKDLLNSRQSTIYKNKPLFSVFGVGDYTFKKWKIAVSALYKRLNFNLIGPLNGKTVIFDDTVNFLSFDTEAEAKFIFTLLTSPNALKFLDSVIFWDEKRPITINILRQLNLKAVAVELGLVTEYLHWSESTEPSTKGQLALALAQVRAPYRVKRIK